MPTTNRYFIEVDCCQHPQKGQQISGEVYLQRRFKNRIILVMASGGRGGIQANLVAQVVATMALEYTILDERAERVAGSIVGTFAANGSGYGSREVKFTIADIHENGRVRLLEFEHPRCMLFRRGQEARLDYESFEVFTPDDRTHVVTRTEFVAQPQDRLIFAGEGVMESGRDTRRMPGGWQREGVIDLVKDSIFGTPTVSAHELCRHILSRAEVNDLFTLKNDHSSFVVYFRQPRRLMICTGPPYNEAKDPILADMVNRHNGSKMICGGTTSQIIARELGRELRTEFRPDPSGLPPVSTMEGIDMVTEGVLTLTKTKSLLEGLRGTDVTGRGTDAEVARMFLSHDLIEFVVGTRINPVHQDPNLPVELELRRNLIRDLSELLRSKFMKEVNIQYM